VADQTPRLSVPEYARVRYFGDRVREATSPAQRDLAIDVAVALARFHHHTGVRWIELAAAFGVSEQTLRHWRLRSSTIPKPPFLPGPAPRTGTTDQPRAGDKILFASGHPRPGGNEFTPEAAAARIRVEPAGVELIEHGCLELGELAALLDKHRPAILHIAAEASFGGVALALDGEPWFCPAATLIATITRATHHPSAVVLNFCNSAWDAKALRTVGIGAIAWAGTVRDQQARMFTSQFYAGLAAGHDLSSSFGRATIPIGVRWPDLQPRVFPAFPNHHPLSLR
jgi:hypothetical protein